MQTFDHFSNCPGDPLDKTIQLRPLEPAPPQALARDFVLKTRRRKGLNDQVNVAKFLETVRSPPCGLDCAFFSSDVEVRVAGNGDAVGVDRASRPVVVEAVAAVCVLVPANFGVEP